MVNPGNTLKCEVKIHMNPRYQVKIDVKWHVNPKTTSENVWVN
jgi:hypothetical protein